MKASSWRELQQGESVTPADEDKQLLHHDCYQPDASLSKQKPNKEKHVWLLESSSFATFAMVAVCWIFLKGYFLIGWLKCFLTQCCEKPKQKPKAKHIKIPTFEREGVKERRKGRKNWISKWREKERKKMNEWKSQRMSKNLEHFYLKNKIIF